MYDSRNGKRDLAIACGGKQSRSPASECLDRLAVGAFRNDEGARFNMNENPHLTLVLGGARSGKSAYAEKLITAHSPPWTYIATAEVLDDEMRARVEAHRIRRGEEWRTLEAPQELTNAIAAAPRDCPLLIDCLTLWLSNRLLAGADFSADRAALVEALSLRAAPTVAVSSEVGLSIVPDNALARAFRDAAGELHQGVAKLAARVALVAAGYPIMVK